MLQVIAHGEKAEIEILYVLVLGEKAGNEGGAHAVGGEADGGFDVGGGQMFFREKAIIVKELVRHDPCILTAFEQHKGFVRQQGKVEPFVFGVVNGLGVGNGGVAAGREMRISSVKRGRVAKRFSLVTGPFVTSRSTKPSASLFSSL